MKYIVSAFLLLAMSPMASASHIGPAGCGLGNAIFHKDNQVLAATTNGSSYNQIFGITSGTSGCTEEGSSAQMIMFIESNKIALSNDAARGQGETIEVLSSFLGCADAQLLGETLKSNYAEIFGKNSDNSIAMSKSIKSTVGNSPVLARTCQRLS